MVMNNHLVTGFTKYAGIKAFKEN